MESFPSDLVPLTDSTKNNAIILSPRDNSSLATFDLNRSQEMSYSSFNSYLGQLHFPRCTSLLCHQPPTSSISSSPTTTSTQPIRLHPNPLTQQSIKQWTAHRPFIPNIPLGASSSHNPVIPSDPHQMFTAHLEPFGTPLPIIDPTPHLQVCMPNTQHDFKIYGDGIELSSIIDNLKSFGIGMLIPISLNVNLINPSNWARTHQIFRAHFS
jgi:hypothetical protein